MAGDKDDDAETDGNSNDDEPRINSASSCVMLVMLVLVRTHAVLIWTVN